MSDKIKCPKDWKVLRMGKRLTKEQKNQAKKFDGFDPVFINVKN